MAAAGMPEITSTRRHRRSAHTRPCVAAAREPGRSNRDLTSRGSTTRSVCGGWACSGLPARFRVALKHVVHDTVRECERELAAEHQAEVNRSHEELRGNGWIGFGAQIPPSYAAGDHLRN